MTLKVKSLTNEHECWVYETRGVRGMGGGVGGDPQYKSGARQEPMAPVLVVYLLGLKMQLR